MGYSDKLNGYWEEGYHYYMEFRDDKLTMREYRRKVILETTVRYDAEALDRGEETEIVPEDPVFDRWPDGKMAMEIRSLRYAGGELKMLRYYTIMGEKESTLKKVEGGPFRHRSCPASRAFGGNGGQAAGAAVPSPSREMPSPGKAWGAERSMRSAGTMRRSGSCWCRRT